MDNLRVVVAAGKICKCITDDYALRVTTEPTNINKIGVAGAQGFGVGVCPEADLPSGMTPLTGYNDKANDNYGNYEYADGSIMVWIPKFYYRIGDTAVNSVDIKGVDTFETSAQANANGYALHRVFIDGGAEKSGFFVDKYMISKKAWGVGYIGSSIKDGLPISTAAAHNPIADLTACTGNYYYEMIKAAHARDGVDGAENASSVFFCCSRFIYTALAMLALAHAQASSATTYCAWYLADKMYPKGCNNNALSDSDDATILYETDGYSNCGKTGSGTPFAKTTHNGQECGVADLNGLMYEVSIGATCIAATMAITGASGETVTGTDIAFVDGGAGEDTITSVAAAFGDFVAGNVITVSGSASNNGNHTIISVVAGTINVATGSLTAEGAGASVTILTGNPCVITVASTAALTTGDMIMITAVVGMTQLNDKLYKITVIDGTTFSLDSIDSTAYTKWASAGTITYGTFYVAKSATAMKDFDSGNSTATDHWGATGVAAMMDALSATTVASMFKSGYAFAMRYGSGANPVLDGALSGENWVKTGLGAVKSGAAVDATGINAFGKDYYYQYIRNELCLHSCGAWDYTTAAGVWTLPWTAFRPNSLHTTGGRFACYPV